MCSKPHNTEWDLAEMFAAYIQTDGQTRIVTENDPTDG